VGVRDVEFSSSIFLSSSLITQFSVCAFRGRSSIYIHGAATRRATAEGCNPQNTKVCVIGFACVRCAVADRSESFKSAFSASRPCHPKLKNLRASRHTPMRRTPARDSTRMILMRYMPTCLSRRCTLRACCSHRVQASQACNPHRRVAPTEHIFHKRAALTGV